MSSCSSSYHDYLISCPQGIKVNARGDVGPYSPTKWEIIDKFGRHYEGDVITEGDGGFTIPIDELPAGLLTPWSGEFELRILDVDNNCKPVPILVAGYYDSIKFTVKPGDRVKDNLGCEVPCAGEISSSEYDETYFGDGENVVFNTVNPFTPGTEEVHVGGLLFGIYEYSVTGINQITLGFAPDDGVEVRIVY